MNITLLVNKQMHEEEGPWKILFKTVFVDMYPSNVTEYE
jgi:hypothetical protein